MSNVQAFWYGFWSLIILTVMVGCVWGDVTINGINMTMGWHRWAIGIACALVLAVIIHSVFWGGGRA